MTIRTLPRAPARADSSHVSPHSRISPPAPVPCCSSPTEELRTYHLSLCIYCGKPQVRSECPSAYQLQSENESFNVRNFTQIIFKYMGGGMGGYLVIPKIGHNVTKIRYKNITFS